MLVAVTGATGFVGQALCARLRSLGHQPQSVPRQPLYENLLSLMVTQRVEVIYHLAGAGRSTGSNDHHREANLETTRDVARAIEDSGFAGNLVFASTAAVYGSVGPTRVQEGPPLSGAAGGVREGPPLRGAAGGVREDAQPRPCSPLGETKWASEKLLLSRLGRLCNVRIARLFNLFGPGQRKLVVYELACRILGGQRPLQVLGNGQELRDFVYIDEAVRGLTHLASLDDTRGALPAGSAEPLVINICSGVALRIEDLARSLLKLAGREEDELLHFLPQTPESRTEACVGDPERLAQLGVRVQPPSLENFRATLEWCGAYRSSCEVR